MFESNKKAKRLSVLALMMGSRASWDSQDFRVYEEGDIHFDLNECINIKLSNADG